MPAPTDSPLFATASTFTADGDTWGSSPNRVDPGAGRIAEGFEPTRLPAEWLNWILHTHGSWSAWLEAERARIAGYVGGAAGSGEWTYDAPRARTVGYGIDRTVFTTDAAGAPLWALPISAYPLARPIQNDARAYLYLPVPTGANLTSVTIQIGANSGARVGAQRWQATVYYQDIGVSLDPAISATVDDGGASGSTTIVLPITSGGHVVGADERVFVLIKGPTGPHASLDWLIQAVASFTDPGPRNY